MIYLKNTTELQRMYVPKMGRTAMGDVTLQIKGTSSVSEVIIESTEGNSSHLYHKMMIALPEDIIRGEYEYTLSDIVGELATGLLVIGDFDNPMEYNKVTTYEQYTE